MRETCKVIVADRSGRWHSRELPCRRPAKGNLANGTPACGLHLRAENRRDKTLSEADAFERRVEAINAALGIVSIASGLSWMRESVCVRLADLEKLARVIGAMPREDGESPQQTP